MAGMNLMDKIISLCKRRGFVFPGSEIYGGLANSWDYGPLGVELKNNIKKLWWQRFVHQRQDMVGLDAALIMNPKVWEASGHVATFSDPLVEDRLTRKRYRADNIFKVRTGREYVESDPVQIQTPKVFEVVIAYLRDVFHVAEASELRNTKQLGEMLDQLSLGVYYIEDEKKVFVSETPRSFNLMFQTFIGPTDAESSPSPLPSPSRGEGRVGVASNVAYFRPETAQAMFVQFKNVLDTTRKKLPFGIAQMGKAFRNEITPGNFIFRTREFEQMEIEYFIAPPKTDADWNEYFEDWRQSMLAWMQEDLGLDLAHVHELEVPKEDLAHYSKRTVDFEYMFPFGTKELYGLAYRTDFDLQNHAAASGQELKYTDPDTGEKFIPHVVEPTWGVDRTFLALLCEHYTEVDDGENKRVYLKLPPKLAPYKAAVFPLLKNKPELVAKAQEIYAELVRCAEILPIVWDDRGNVGKRYYSQDEIGTPYCITVDFQTLEDGTVTIRDRDTTEQTRLSVAAAVGTIRRAVIF